MPDATRSVWSPARVSAIGTGGAIGATCRWAAVEALPDSGPFPWATLLVNIAGSLLLGALLAQEWSHRNARLVFHDAGAIGFCGGLTTFSSFAVETVHLVRSEHVAIAAEYAVASTVVTVVGVVAGAASVRRWRDAGRPVEGTP